MINIKIFYNLLSRTKNFGSKRINNLRNNLDAKDAFNLLDSNSLDSINKLSNAIQPKTQKIGRMLAIDLMSEWNTTLRYEYYLFDFFTKNNIVLENTENIIKKIALLYKERVFDIIAENPYLLVRFFDFNTIDAIGIKLKNNTNNRLLGLVDYIIKKELSYGNTALSKDSFRKKIMQTIPDVDFGECLRLALLNKKIIINNEKNLIHFFGAHSLENFIIKTIDELSKKQSLETVNEIKNMLNDFEESRKFFFSEEQRKAIMNAVRSNFYCIVGYAGTGKSTCLEALVYILKKMGRHIEMAALSGKASLRMSQDVDLAAKTIFKFLHQIKESKKLENTNKPISNKLSQIKNKTTIILDESSMIDLANFASIFRAIKNDTQIICLGDDFQLVPIGFGLVFHKLVKQPIWTSKLQEVFRQQKENNIPIVGKLIREGKIPNLDTYRSDEENKNGIVFFKSNILDFNNLEKIVKKLNGFDVEKSNLHIVSATNKVAKTINLHMHNLYKKDKVEIKGYLGNVFSKGDLIVFNQNDYTKEIRNGMIGLVTDVQVLNNGFSKLHAKFGNKIFVFKGSEINKISLGYCLTCHKLQGSQVENIIVLLEDVSIAETTWLYTAMTRAKKRVVLYGKQEAYEKIFQKKTSCARRKVGLNIANCNTF